jgi:nucleotide-binding universal stress UspA family protein
MFRSVLIGVDGTSHGRDAIALAGLLAEPGGRLTLAHVQPGALPASVARAESHMVDPTYYAAGRDESRQLLERERTATGVDAALVTVPGPAVGPALHALAAEQSADLLVVGACKHRLAGRILIGDDTRASVMGATCPVAIAPHGFAVDARPPATIGVGFDLSAESRVALEVARDLAARHAANVIALDVVPVEPIVEYLRPLVAEPDGPPVEILTRHRARFAEQLGEIENVEARAVTGVPYRALAEFADAVDLLVVGSRSQGLVRRLVFGSMSLRLARHTHHAMLVIPRAAIGPDHPVAVGSAQTAGVGVYAQQ